MDPLASRLSFPVTEQSVAAGSSSFSPGQSTDTATDVILCRIKQRSHTLDQYTREFLSISHYATLPDCIQIEVFCDGVNEPLRARLRREGPRSSLEAFMNLALSCVGSPCTVGVAERERDDAVVATARPARKLAVMPEHDHTNTFSAWIAREMPAVSERAHATVASVSVHKMAATAELVHNMTAKTEPRHVTAAIPEPCKVTAAFPESNQVSESSQVATVFPESSQVSKSSQFTAAFPESSQVRLQLCFLCQVKLELSPANGTSVKPAPANVTSVKPAPANATPAKPQPAHAMPARPEPAPVMAAFPQPVHKMAPIPEPVHKMAAFPEPVHKMAAVPEPVHKMAATSKPVHKMAAIPEPLHKMVC
ncbi:hypothetical protein M9458_051722 [Cirrhinus mrigala]|uniref:Retrotransposon gag domain-containing protein n=1 Tax=Cirrhinus mrigala TaxID=683832 RepID=A0ABD0MSG3_CIRMR